MLVNSLQIAAIANAWADISSALGNFGIRDVLDIAIVAGFTYFILLFIKQTRSYFILTAIVILLVMGFISNALDLALTKSLIQPLLATLAIVVVVLFQRDIRRFLKWISYRRSLSFTPAITATTDSLQVVADTVWEMAANNIGAIIVFSGEAPLDDVIEGGVALDGEVSRPLILSIFDSNSPGHDGAMLVENNKVKAFGLHLPLAEDFKDILSVGTRHRAAVGITERTDSMAIVVSEERGEVSVAEKGRLRSVDNKEALFDILKMFSKENDDVAHKGFWYYLIVSNIWAKILSVALAFVLWILIH